MNEQFYWYNLIPGIIIPSAGIKYDTSYYKLDEGRQVFDDHGRGYIPVVDLSNKNDFAKSRYFRGDYVSVSWFWLDLNDVKILDPFEFRGADI